MIALTLLACLALASAAPHHHGHFGYHDHRPFMRPPPPPGPPRDSSDFFNGGMFDTHRFWEEMEMEMQKFDQMMNEFQRYFPTTSSECGIKGNEYIVTINLNEFDEKDIRVKASKEGVLMVQAVHKTDDGNERSHLELKTLPSNVNINGTWTFNAGVLKIVFPLNKKPDEVTETNVVVVETESSNQGGEEGQGQSTGDRDREEVEETQTETVNQDADVGVERGDRDNDSEILTNFIPTESTVEGTTYAVDLKNEVEFVPVNVQSY